MKLLLVAELIFAFGCAIRDKSYIELLEAEILVRDIVIKDYHDLNVFISKERSLPCLTSSTILLNEASDEIFLA